MDTGSALVGAVFVIIITLPFILMGHKKRGTKKQMMEQLVEIARRHNSQLNEYELCSNFVVGIDEKKKCVFFFKQSKENIEQRFIDLSTYSTCYVYQKNKILNSQGNNQSMIEKVELRFVPVRKELPETKLELFDMAIDMQLYGELQFAEKWTKKINEMFPI